MENNSIKFIKTFHLYQMKIEGFDFTQHKKIL